jgi:hypothetical protein
LTHSVDSVDRVLLGSVNCQSPHGRGIFTHLTNLTESLGGGTRLRGGAPARPRPLALCPSPARESVKLVKWAFVRLPSCGSQLTDLSKTSVKCRPLVGQIGGWAA